MSRNPRKCIFASQDEDGMLAKMTKFDGKGTVMSWERILSTAAETKQR